jgi:hypothetical protein
LKASRQGRRNNGCGAGGTVALGAVGLAALMDQGALTEEEFEKAKAKLLAQP